MGQVSDDSESDGEYDVARNWLYAKNDNSKYDDDTKDAVNRKWTHSDQLSEDEEESNEYDIARGWLYAKSDAESKTDEPNAETLEETFGTNDVAVIFVFVVIAMLSLGIGLFVGCVWKGNNEQKGAKEVEYV